VLQKNELCGFAGVEGTFFVTIFVVFLIKESMVIKEKSPQLVEALQLIFTSS